MTPLDFLRRYELDRRSIRGGYFSSAPLEVKEGERVGVVLLNSGGPETLSDVQSFLYNVLMDPARVDLPIPGFLRHWLCKALAFYWSGSLRDDYELIGGGSQLTRLTHEQADSLESHLNEHFGEPTGIDFRTYVAMRYWHPFSEEVASRMENDDVDRVVLLPLFPQYSKSTSGSSLAYWNALGEAEEIPSWPTTSVLEYAANPKYVQALSERINEGLQRFPPDRRDDVELLFSAYGTSLRDRNQWKDPYCCLVHSTVEQVMNGRGRDRPYHTAFQERVGLTNSLTPATTDKIERLAQKGTDAVLVVPVAFVTDHVGTSYDLDIRVRQRAEEVGITHYEVTSGLNTHPLFIEALGEATVAQLNLPVDVNQLRVGGDGLSQDYPLRAISDMPTYDVQKRQTKCPDCDCVAEAHRWGRPDDAPRSEAVQPGDDGAEGTMASDSRSPSS